MKFPFFASVAANLQFANYFLENELVEDNLRELQTTLLKRFFPDLLRQSETEIKQTASNIVSLLKELILLKIVTQYEELLFIDFKRLLEAHDDEIERYHHMQDETNEYLKTYANEQTKNKDQLEACGERQTRTSGMSEREYASFLKREFEQNVHVIKRV